MEFDQITFFLTFFLGNGLLIAIFTFITNWIQSKSQRDFEARQKASEYYMTLFGQIAILDELARGYPRSLTKEAKGKAAVFKFNEHEFGELTSKQILERYNEAYENFSSYYIKKKSEGYEIFIEEKLGKLLSKLWISAKTFYDDNAEMKDEKQIEKFHNLAKKTVGKMEKLFGLK